MFRNQYDTDVTTWSPAGRLHQVEYAMEAVKQGSCTVGLRSDEVVVLGTVKRSPGDLASYQKKMFKVDTNLGVAISGLTSDGRYLCKYMRNEAINQRYVFETPMNVGRLVQQIADKAQVATQRSSKRPFGVGMLVAGYDQTGPHLYNTCPSGNAWEYKAMAIGARSQASKTYLEKTFETYPGASQDELIRHCLLALRESLAEGELTVDNAAVAVVGKGVDFTFIEGEDIRAHLEAAFADDEGNGAATAAPME